MATQPQPEGRTPEPEGQGGPPAEGGRPPGSAARRRRGSRGGRGRSRASASTSGSPSASTTANGDQPQPQEQVRAEAAQAPKPKIGDTRPAPQPKPKAGDARPSAPADDAASKAGTARRRRRGGRGRSSAGGPVVAETADLAEYNEARRGRERKGRPVGRYLMAVHVRSHATQIAVLEGRALIEHYVSRPADDVNQIDGNIYLGRVQNVLPGMEAAFVDIGTPKNAVLYRGDVRYDQDDVVEGGDGKGQKDARIEQLLRPGQTILCQVTKNPIGTKGARLTQEVSLPGRFCVLVPNSDTYGISKRLSDDERKRLRRILDDVRPEGHGLIVRTAAEGANADELRRDVALLEKQWKQSED